MAKLELMVEHLTGSKVQLHQELEMLRSVHHNTVEEARQASIRQNKLLVRL